MSTKAKVHRPVVRTPLAKVPTGITGFDEITQGGLPLGRTTLVRGGPGCGKTVFAVQSLINHARDRREPGILVAFEERADQIVANAATLGWDIPDLAARRLFFLDASLSPEMISDGQFDLTRLLSLLRALAQEDGAASTSSSTGSTCCCGCSTILRRSAGRSIGSATGCRRAGSPRSSPRKSAPTTTQLLQVPVHLKRSGIETKLVLAAGPPPPAHGRTTLALQEALAKALRWNQELLDGTATSLAALSTRDALDPCYTSRVLKLGFLAPDISEAIIAGRLPETLSLEILKKDIPLDWAAQRRKYGFDATRAPHTGPAKTRKEKTARVA